MLTFFVAVKKVILPPLLDRFECWRTQFLQAVDSSLPWFPPQHQRLSLPVGQMSCQHYYRNHYCQTTLPLPPAEYNNKSRNSIRVESPTFWAANGNRKTNVLLAFNQIFIKKRQGRVVQKPVNTNPGLKVDRNIMFLAYKTLFHCLCILVPRGRAPSAQHQESRPLLAGPDFLSMCRVFVLPYSPPIRFVTEIWQKVRESWTSSIGPAQRSSPKVAILGFRRKGARPLGKRMGNHNPANLILSTVPRIKALKQIKKL